MHDDSFCNWLVTAIRETTAVTVSPPPFLIWCDGNREWLDLLHKACAHANIELWAPPSLAEAPHELLVRDRFCREQRRPRVIWFPVGKHDLTWFKVFELQAARVWDRRLIDALRDYGVHIPRDQEREMAPLLPAHCREWFDQPKKTWKELTYGQAKGTLVDNQRMLEVLAGEAGEFERLKQEDRFKVFVRRATEDFGFPDPTASDEETWRVQSTARLLATEAASECPQCPPAEGPHIVPPGLARTSALDLLRNWQRDVHLMPSFERLVPKADNLLSLRHWAASLSAAPRSHASRAVEETLFRQWADRLDRIEEVSPLVRELDKQLEVFQDRVRHFWEQHAQQKAGWTALVQLARAARTLNAEDKIEERLTSATQAVEWYAGRGWRLDEVNETLFAEVAGFPSSLERVRARLRRGLCQALDRIGRTFSERYDKAVDKLSSLPTAGELLLKQLEASREPTALLYLDGLRLELGHRLVELLNAKEQVQRATLQVAVAPVPSITPLGMAFALPMPRSQLRVALASDPKRFEVVDVGHPGDLAVREQRKGWLTSKFEVKDFLDVHAILDGGEGFKKPGKGRRIVVVLGQEFDQAGHDGQLAFTGADDHLQRYAQAVRRLREAGYCRILIATDHGFFHWQPEKEELEGDLPTGEVLWSSRRAFVGRSLKHKSAVRAPVAGSDLEALLTRSFNAFKTYGGLGFFHGGVSLQELVIPVITVTYPAKAAKVPVVLKPVGIIGSMAPRVQVEEGMGQLSLLENGKVVARPVVVKIKEKASGKVVFRQEGGVTIEPGGAPVIVQLGLVDDPPQLASGTPLIVEVLDADNEEILDSSEVPLKVDIDDWA